MPQFPQFGDGPQAIRGNPRMRIPDGEFSSGSELKIQSLAEEFGASIMPEREALRMPASAQPAGRNAGYSRNYGDQ